MNRMAGCTEKWEAFDAVVRGYRRHLRVLRFPAITLAVLLATIALNVYLYTYVPSFFPQQDNGRLSVRFKRTRYSFQAMDKILSDD
jgi:multidrug efflux pump